MLSAAKHLLYLIEKKNNILRGVYPEPLRYSQGRSQRKGEWAQDDMSRGLFFRSLLDIAEGLKAGS